jgi:CheY-like chemotaxis protein
MSAKILVIDDNPTNLKLVSELLEFEGHKILKAADAEEAQVVLADTLPAAFRGRALGGRKGTAGELAFDFREASDGVRQSVKLLGSSSLSSMSDSDSICPRTRASLLST